MARILVTGATDTMAERRVLELLIATMRNDGHDAAVIEGKATDAIEGADALVAVLDRCPNSSAAAVAYASAQNKPVLGLATKGQPQGILAEMTELVEGTTESDWLGGVNAFYEVVRPFAGRVVRDRIPDLVKEAGHQVAFRQLSAEERPRFLKQKVATEAQELLRSDVGKEREEVADVLEALEAFIAARGFSRDDLRRIKEHKRKQRGGFERCFVVESTSGTPRASEAEQARPTETSVSAPADPPRSVPGDAGEINFEYSDEPETLEAPPEDIAKGREVKGEFFEI